jgi:hypothetical protein
MGALWDFLRDPENRAALQLLGATLAALAFAGWTVWLERKTARKLADIESAVAGFRRELDEVRKIQAVVLSRLDRQESRHDLLITAMLQPIPLSRTGTGPKPDETRAPDVDDDTT